MKMGDKTILTNEVDTPVEGEVTDTPVEDTPTEEVVEDTPTEDTPVEEVVYDDFNLPEGVEIDSETMTSAAELFKEAGLSKEQAQKFVDMQVALNERSNASNEAVRDGWLESAKSDKEYGGDKFDESVGIAVQAVKKFGNPELEKMLNETGVGNHPEMIRLLKRVGDLTREDNPLNPGNPPAAELSTLEILYPQK